MIDDKSNSFDYPDLRISRIKIMEEMWNYCLKCLKTSTEIHLPLMRVTFLIFTRMNLLRVPSEITEATKFENLIGEHKIKQWNQFLKESNSKAILLRILCKEWKKVAYSGKLEGKELFLAYDRMLENY